MSFQVDDLIPYLKVRHFKLHNHLRGDSIEPKVKHIIMGFISLGVNIDTANLEEDITNMDFNYCK